MNCIKLLVEPGKFNFVDGDEPCPCSFVGLLLMLLAEAVRLFKDVGLFQAVPFFESVRF